MYNHLNRQQWFWPDLSIDLNKILVGDGSCKPKKAEIKLGVLFYFKISIDFLPWLKKKSIIKSSTASEHELNTDHNTEKTNSWKYSKTFLIQYILDNCYI